MSQDSQRRSSRKRTCRPPVKLTVKILSPGKKRKRAKIVSTPPDIVKSEVPEPEVIIEKAEDSEADLSEEDGSNEEISEPEVSDSEKSPEADEEDKGNTEVADHDYYAGTECNYCSWTFDDRGKLLAHIRKKHLTKSLFCMCHGRQFTSKKSKDAHEEKTQNGTFGMRKNYRKYTQETLMKAYEAVKAGKMTTRKASRHFNIPFTTLLDRVAGRFEVNSFMQSSGPPPLICREDEQKLSEHIQFMAAIGYSYLRSSVVQLATDLAVFKGMLDEGKTLSDNWYRKFIKRCPIMAKKPKEDYPDNPLVVKKYFEEYVQILKTHDLLKKPENIYCLSVYELSMSQLELEGTGQKKKKYSRETERVSIILCCNAAGTTMAPFFVFSGLGFTDKLLEGCLPDSQARVTVTGEVDSHIFKDYFRNHLLKLLGKEHDQVIVLYNGHLIHFEMERIDWARKHGVLLFALPPQMGLIKTSLDSTLKDKFHSIFKQEAKKYKKLHSGDALTKYNVSSVVTKVFPQIFTTRMLVRFFKNAGIYPVGPEMVEESITLKDVEAVNESIYDSLDSTDAFLEVRLPFPTVANRVMKRRNELPAAKSLHMLAQGMPTETTTNDNAHNDEEGRQVESTTGEHNYVLGVTPTPGQSDSSIFSVKPVIDVVQVGNAAYGVGYEVNHPEVVAVVPKVEEGCETLEAVPVVETQVVSSVVEVGTTESEPNILQMAAANALPASNERADQSMIHVETTPDGKTEKCAYVTDPITGVRYKILFAYK